MPGPAPDATRLSRVGIVGLGLIGGSIAAGLRARRREIHITGLDEPAVLDQAHAAGLIDVAARDLADLAGLELIVLAAPIPAILKTLSEWPFDDDGPVVTDVASTKRQVMAAAARVKGFVGGHPVAGAAHGGLAHARADLFDGRPWVLVGGETHPGLTRVGPLVGALGGRTLFMTAEAHDRAMAYVSHLPQIIAVALMHAAAEACGEPGLAAAGSGFREMTRLAASPGDLWHGILDSNRDFVEEALRSFQAALPAEEGSLQGDRVQPLFARANRHRAALERDGE
jgi:prephenate dehydrogenase